MPHRMVIDPNVFISALMTKPGSPNLAIAQAVTTNKLTLVACPALLQELSGSAPGTLPWMVQRRGRRAPDRRTGADRRDAP
jgi:hypothetical protein